MVAARALIEMSAEHGRATPRNGQQTLTCFQVITYGFVR